MKLIIAFIGFIVLSALPAFAQNANGSSGATTYGPTSGGSGGAVGSTSVSPPNSRGTYSDSTRALNKAKKEGAPAKKTDRATVTFGPEDDSADGGVTKSQASKAPTTNRELKSGKSSTGETGHR